MLIDTPNMYTYTQTLRRIRLQIAAGRARDSQTKPVRKRINVSN